MIQVGERIDNYVMLKRLGKNSFGEVWSAQESITDRLIRFNRLESRDEYQTTRFVRAIALLSRLNHPAILACTGHGFHEHLPYVATENVQGPTIASLIAYGGRMDEQRVLQIALQVADGLEHAWKAAGIIHRNLGPESILVDLASMEDEQSGGVRIKIFEFGHALGRRLVDQYDPEQVAAEKAFQEEAQKETVGAAMTMSPEQVACRTLTPASDMYALGITMYHLLTGQAPFKGSDEEVKAAHLRATPLDLAQVVPGINGGTAAFVRKLLAKTPDGRFPDWGTVRGKIQPLIDHLLSRRPPPSAGGGSGTGRVPVPPPGAVAPGGQVGAGGGSGTRNRGTATFDRTPTGVAIPGNAPLDMPPPPSAGHVTGRTSSSGWGGPPTTATGGGTGWINPAAARAGGGPPSGGYPQVAGQGGGSDDRLLIAMLAERLRAPIPPEQLARLAGQLPAAAPTVAVDDGLTPEQRVMVWSMLLQNRALTNASVGVPPEPFETTSALVRHGNDTSERIIPRSLPKAASAESDVFRSDPEIPGIPSDAEQVGGRAGEQAVTEAEELSDAAEAPPVAEPEAEAYSHLFQPGGPPAPDAAEPASNDRPGNPLLSPVWKQVIQMLRNLLLGKVRYQEAGSGSGISRITSGLRRLVAGRDTMFAQVNDLLGGGRFDEAEALIEKLAGGKSSVDPAEAMRLLVLRARLFGLRGDSAASLRWAQIAVQKDGSDSRALALVALSHLQLRRIQTAMAVFDELTAVHRGSFYGPLGQSAILLLAGLHSKVTDTLAEAERRERNPAVLELAILHFRAVGDVDGELSLLQQQLGGPDDWKVRERIQQLTAAGGDSRSETGARTR